MKKLQTLLLAIFLFSLLNTGCSQNRKSPHETVSGTIEGAQIEITYGRPFVKGRDIWGNLVSYEKVWRTGADEATTFETDKNLIIAGGLLPKGKYALFTIPQENGPWQVIFNSNYDQWGAYDYDEEKDILRVDVEPVVTDMTEQLTISIDDEQDQVNILWDEIMLPLEVGLE